MCYNGTHPWNEDTSLIRARDQGCWTSLKCALLAPWSEDTSLIRTHFRGPRVSVLVGFHCILFCWDHFMSLLLYLTFSSVGSHKGQYHVRIYYQLTCLNLCVFLNLNQESTLCRKCKDGHGITLYSSIQITECTKCWEVFKACRKTESAPRMSWHCLLYWTNKYYISWCWGCIGGLQGQFECAFSPTGAITFSSDSLFI